MRVGMLRAELRIPGCRSLKEKRRPLKSLLERLRNRFHVSAAEVDYQDKHQRAAIGVAVVGSDGRHVAERLRAVREFIELNGECAVLDIQQAIGSGPDPYGADFSALAAEYDDTDEPSED